MCAADVSTTALDERLAERIRASILLAGPLLGRFGRAEVPPPGGDVIGRRRVDTHLFALAGLGAIVEVERAYKFWAPGGLRGAELFLDEASVTGTENALMAAALAEGRTTIVNAACEPHVQELCELLQSMGSHIEGIGSNLLHIDGRRELGGAWHRVRADHIEIGSFIGLAAVTGGDLVIEARAARPAGHPARVRAAGGALRPASRRLAARAGDPGARDPGRVGGQLVKIEDGPWPMSLTT